MTVGHGHGPVTHSSTLVSPCIISPSASPFTVVACAQPSCKGSKVRVFYQLNSVNLTFNSYPAALPYTAKGKACMG